MKLVVLLAFVAVAAASVEFESFKATYGKTYTDAIEESNRRAIFSANSAMIANHNAAGHSYVLEMNQFGDLTNAEFQRLHLAPVMNISRKGESFVQGNEVDPTSVDWRSQGYVTPIKDQGQCGSCWAFSTTGSFEGAHFKSTGKLVSFSEQNLVDCSTKEGNQGCNGGLMDNAFTYVIKNGGLDTEASYPYTARDGTCKYNPANSGGTLSKFVDVTAGSEAALQSAVATVGPVSVAIDASHNSFQFYKSGIYNEPLCSSKNLDHGVLAVGYGTSSGTNYWIVKNSWGTVWGNQGYIQMTKDKRNQCGIATAASYPIV